MTKAALAEMEAENRLKSKECNAAGVRNRVVQFSKDSHYFFDIEAMAPEMAKWPRNPDPLLLHLHDWKDENIGKDQQGTSSFVQNKATEGIPRVDTMQRHFLDCARMGDAEGLARYMKEYPEYISKTTSVHECKSSNGTTC